MKKTALLTRLGIVFLLIGLSACAAGPPPEAEVAGEPIKKDFEDFNPGDFTRPTQINNKWFPLEPGTQFVYDGITVEDGRNVPHRLIITVTDLTKVIGGVRAVVTFDRDFSADTLVEAELAFFAQDKNGTVWRMGEYPEEYENGEFVAAPTWIHGFEDARAGIAMPADPQLGDPGYSQGWGPAVGWTDRGQVDQVGQEACVPVTCYKNVLVISETSQAEEGAFQLKSFAPGVGNVRTDWRGADKSQEVLELVELTRLDADQLAEVRAQALELETHAYQVSSMYAQTSPVEFPEGTPAITVPVNETPQASMPSGPVEEIVIYAEDLSEKAVVEMSFMDDPASPGGKFIGLPNEGDELDPPPQNDPHAVFKVQAVGGVPYRCWVHMKVGSPYGKSTANVIWVQVSGAIDPSNKDILQPGSSSYLTAQGPLEEGWTWVECGQPGGSSLVTFRTGGEITVRLQAGMEGVGFDQFILSPEEFLEAAPSEPVIEK